MILNPNCSEEVFRLIGSLEDVKREVINMLECIREEYSNDEESKWKTRVLSQIKERKKRIEDIKSIDEFIEISFPFTCNYDTYFEPDGDYLNVATCNNHIWDRVDYEKIPDVDDGHYYNMSERYMDIIAKGYKWIIVKEMDDYDTTKTHIFEVVKPHRTKDINISYSKTNAMIRKLGDGNYCSYDKDGNIIRLEEITSEKIRNNPRLNEIVDKIMVDML